MDKIKLSKKQVDTTYGMLRENIAIVRKRLKRSLTLTEKVLLGHLDNPKKQELIPGSSYLNLRPDRVIMQDATAQMALLQFISAGIDKAQLPASVHCDHLIKAKSGASSDMDVANKENNEVYKFLESVTSRYNIGFWKPGSGIIHQVALEHYAFPGGLMIGTDSHTVNAGGIGMIAVGVGGADAVDVLVGMPWEVLYPKTIGVKLTGKLSGWTAPKDVILKLAGILTVKGGTNRIVEYFGEGVETISCTGKATIANMGAELGATTSIFPYDKSIGDYLLATKRGFAKKAAEKNIDLLRADEDVAKNPIKYFDKVIEIDLSKLKPHIVGPHTPDLAREVSDMRSDLQKNGYPENISAALIGSCTNSSYEDIYRAVDIIKQAKSKGLSFKIPLMISPGSETVRATIERDGLIKEMESIGVTVLANACGPCIGQWERTDIEKGTPNSILTSFNRNFPKRNDGDAATNAFIGSPEVVVAYALTGSLQSNPIDEPINQDGKSVKLDPPSVAPSLPPQGFVDADIGYIAPSKSPKKVKVIVEPDSKRLEILEPFKAPESADEFADMPLLIKVKGKCTTDHISMAGPWLKFRGHLDNISNNMLIGAINAFNGKSNAIRNLLSGEIDDEVPKVARAYKEVGRRWVVVGDENYGEGSSREHAAMSPRFLGAGAIICRSFARIHETNLKKQGLLPLTFKNPADYDKIEEGDLITIVDPLKIKVGEPVKVKIRHKNGKKGSFTALHTLNAEQIKWFKKGSALNKIRYDLMKK